MDIRRIESGKRDFLPLLLLGDEQEDMIDRYLDRGTLLALYDGGLRAVCVVTKEAPGVFEIKNLAVEPAFQRQGYGRAMVRHVAGACRNLLGWLFYLSFQTIIFDTYQLYKIKSGKKEAKEITTEAVALQEKEPQNTIEPVTQIAEEASSDVHPIELNIDPKRHEEIRSSYEDEQDKENKRRIRMVVEYIHFYMPRIADEETVNHVCNEVSNWMNKNNYKPKPIKRRLTQDISNIPLRHFIWNIAERCMYKRYYNGDNRARFVKELFPREFAETDIATIKNFRIDPLKPPIPIDELEDGKLDFHYPNGYLQKE